MTIEFKYRRLYWWYDLKWFIQCKSISCYEIVDHCTCKGELKIHCRQSRKEAMVMIHGNFQVEISPSSTTPWKVWKLPSRKKWFMFCNKRRYTTKDKIELTANLLYPVGICFTERKRNEFTIELLAGEFEIEWINWSSCCFFPPKTLTILKLKLF